MDKIEFGRFEKGQIYKTDIFLLPSFYVRVLEDSDAEDSNFECVMIHMEPETSYKYKVGETFKPLKKQYIFDELVSLFKLTPFRSDDEVFEEERRRIERKGFANPCQIESIAPKASEPFSRHSRFRNDRRILKR